MELSKQERKEYKRIKANLEALQRRLNRKQEKAEQKERRLLREAKQTEREIGSAFSQQLSYVQKKGAVNDQ